MIDPYGWWSSLRWSITQIFSLQVIEISRTSIVNKDVMQISSIGGMTPSGGLNDAFLLHPEHRPVALHHLDGEIVRAVLELQIAVLRSLKVKLPDDGVIQPELN